MSILDGSNSNWKNITTLVTTKKRKNVSKQYQETEKKGDSVNSLLLSYI